MNWTQYQLNHPRLRPVVKDVLVNQSQKPVSAGLIRLFPENGPSLYMDFTGKFSEGEAWMNLALSAPGFIPRFLALRGAIEADQMIVRFYPGALLYYQYRVSPVPNAIREVDFIGRLPVTKIYQALAQHNQTKERLLRLESFLVSFLGEPEVSDKMILSLTRCILEKNSLPENGDLAAYSNLSLRQLQRNFLSRVGMNMKSFLKVSRFQYAKKILLSAKTDMALAGYRAGYYDQAQFSRQFKSLSGFSPLRFCVDSNVCRGDVPELGKIFPRLSL